MNHARWQRTTTEQIKRTENVVAGKLPNYWVGCKLSVYACIILVDFRFVFGLIHPIIGTQLFFGNTLNNCGFLYLQFQRS